MSETAIDDRGDLVHDRSDPQRWNGVEVRGYLDPDLEILTRAKGGDGRTVIGRIVPYNVRQQITPNLVEMFRAGSAAHHVANPRRMRFAHEHVKLGGKVIGRATELREDAGGPIGYLRASATPAGDEALELVRDGVIDELSIGFHAVTDKRHPDGLVERVRVNILETALVLQGAYGQGARIQGLRSAEDGQDVADDEPPARETITASGMSVVQARALAARTVLDPVTAARLDGMIR